MSATPTRVRVRAYQVGFGDCLLVSVAYDEPLPDGRREGHILVDFGSKVLSRGGPKLADLAARIAEHCGGHLDAVVATHRHQDHVRGFGDAKAQGHLDPLKPDVLVRPWTDLPAAARTDPSSGLGEKSQAFLGLLEKVAEHSAQVPEQFGLDRSDLARRAAALAELGVANVDALAMLDAWVDEDRTSWVKAGDDVDVALPGVQIHVLGPPTLEQVPGLRSYASASAEYWLGLTGAGQIEPELAAVAPDELGQARETVAAPGGVGRAAWLLEKLHRTGKRQALQILEGFDDVLNNTSVVLLLAVGDRQLLLAGDAQVENWSWTLDRARGDNGQPEDPALRDRLAAVDLYKVGHHGSRNATPKRLVELWRTARPAGRPLCSVLSTSGGVYGASPEGEVPHARLLEALQGLGEVHSTEDLPEDVWWFDVEAPATGGDGAFSFSAGPPQA